MNIGKQGINKWKTGIYSNKITKALPSRVIQEANGCISFLEIYPTRGFFLLPHQPLKCGNGLSMGGGRPPSRLLGDHIRLDDLVGHRDVG